MWAKRNMFSHSDGTDTWGCDTCGFKRKYRMMGIPRECPKCEIKRVKIIGAWIKSKDVGRHRCYVCGSEYVLVPREGNQMSYCWKAERQDGLVVVMCPNGCPEQPVLDVKLGDKFWTCRSCGSRRMDKFTMRLHLTRLHRVPLGSSGTRRPIGNTGILEWCVNGVTFLEYIVQ
jgi:hypothetical protein